MIIGYVNTEDEAVINVTIQGQQNQVDEFEAIIDTGFNGFLTLPLSMINRLGLPWFTQGRVTLANGDEELIDIHIATIIWDGLPRRLMVDTANTTPLIGMALMRNYELNIQNIDNGIVTLKKL